MLPVFQVVVLSFAFSGEPATLRSKSNEETIHFYSAPAPSAPETLIVDSRFDVGDVIAATGPHTSVLRDFSSVERREAKTVQAKFEELYMLWLSEIGHVSSTTRKTESENYQAIVRLGWEAVPLILQTLQNGRGHLYLALNAITGVRPFDRKDIGDVKRMKEAWLDWGRKKGYI